MLVFLQSSLSLLMHQTYYQNINHSDTHSSKQYAQSYFIDTEGSQPDGITLLYLADPVTQLCTNQDNVQMNPSLKSLQKILHGDVIYYFPRNGPFQEQTPSSLNTLESLLSDFLTFLKVIIMMRNYNQIVVVGFGPYGQLAQEIKYSFSNLISSAVNVEYLYMDKFSALMSDESLTPIQKFNLYTNLQYLDMSKVDFSDIKSKQYFKIQHKEYMEESSNDLEIYCQIFGNLYKIPDFEILCAKHQLSTQSKALGQEENRGSDFFGVQGRSGDLGILVARASKYDTGSCGDTLGLQFNVQDLGKRIVTFLENVKNI